MLLASDSTRLHCRCFREQRARVVQACRRTHGDDNREGEEEAYANGVSCRSHENRERYPWSL